jgi:BirA family biotin operon repressor/biotin-[acetyl-CoA-carboxylase] ligase
VNAGPARVLESLRRAGGESRSGETISAEQGVSRAQVWKHVQTLRAHGYIIEAEAGDGYRLVSVPDRLYPEEILPGLSTRWLARDIRYFDTTDSTNRIALELAQGGAEHGTTVIADAQTAGRGRLGRSFFSPPYTNLYTSIVLRPRVTTAEAPAWILASAVAVAETLAEAVPAPGDVEIKWPNDVLLGGRKSCGILMELGAEATRVAYLVLGIGVNLNVDRERFPDEFRATATSLSSHLGRPVERVSFARRLYENLEPVLDTCAREGFDGVLPRFQSHFRMVGRRVRVRDLDGGERAGTVAGIDRDGALRLAPDGDGDEQRIVAGDVTLAKEQPA